MRYDTKIITVNRLHILRDDLDHSTNIAASKYEQFHRNARICAS
jgi:hypothetical protein